MKNFAVDLLNTAVERISNKQIKARTIKQEACGNEFDDELLFGITSNFAVAYFTSDLRQ